jgi:DNA-binding LytR/AlgR family response regulator
MINCVIVDDEPLARQGLTRYVSELDFLHLTGTCENPIQLTAMLEKNSIDLIFLDIQMPKMTGLDFLKMTGSKPMVVITTAFPGFALEGFQLDVLDYLVKPITFERFFKAASKARDYKKLTDASTANSNTANADNYFFVKSEGKFEKINYDDILYVEGMQNYIVIHTPKRKYATLLTLKNFEESLSNKPFLRVHKSFIVSTTRIDSIESHEIIIQGAKIPLSKNYRDEVMEKVLTKRVIDRWSNDPSGESS